METLLALALIGLLYFCLSGQYRKIPPVLVMPQKRHRAKPANKALLLKPEINPARQRLKNSQIILSQSLRDPHCKDLRQTAIDIMISEKKVDGMFLEAKQQYPDRSDRELWKMVLHQDYQHRNGRWWS